MKRKILVILLIAIMALSMAILSACAPAQTPNNENVGGDGGDGGNLGEQTPPEEEPPSDEDDVPVPIKVMYRYLDYYDGDVKLMEQTVNLGEHFSQEQLAQKDSLYRDGYRFDYFYISATSLTEFDFSAPLEDLDNDGVVKIYCDRDLKKAGENITWTVSPDRETLTFVGEGDMYAYRVKEVVPWMAYSSRISKVIIPEGITSIANCAFYGFLRLESIELPSTIEKIGTNAFGGSSIADINFPESLTRIGANAFNKCTNLVHLDFNAKLQFVEHGAFYECTGIKSLVLNDAIVNIGSSAFYQCTSIEAAYYLGTPEQYKTITSGIDNYWLENLAQTWYYMESNPENIEDGLPKYYWHYNEDGRVETWYYAIWYMTGPEAKVPFFVDYLDKEKGISEYNVSVMNNAVFHGYRFDHFKFYDPQTGIMKDDKYTMTEGEVYHGDIRLIGFRGDLCGENLKWSIRNRVLQIERINKSVPEGRMWDFETSTDAPWNGRHYKTVEIKDGVSYIGKNAFCYIFDAAFTTMVYIDIPTCVTEIHTMAIQGCNNMLYVYYHGTAADLYGDAEKGIEPTIKGLTTLSTEVDYKVYTKAPNTYISDAADGAYWTYQTVNRVTRRVAWVWDSAEKTLLVGGGDYSNDCYNTTMDYTNINQAPWYGYRNEVEKIIVNENITKLDANTFKDMANVAEIVVNPNILQISETAISGTEFYTSRLAAEGEVYLKWVSKKGNLEKYYLVKVSSEKSGLYRVRDYTYAIAENAFLGCMNITSLIIPKDVLNVGINEKSFIFDASSGGNNVEKIYYYGAVQLWQGLNVTNFNGAQLYFHKTFITADDRGVKVWEWQNEGLGNDIPKEI